MSLLYYKSFYKDKSVLADSYRSCSKTQVSLSG